MTDADLLAHYDQLSDTDRAAYLAQLDAEDDARDARLRAPGALAAAATWYASQGIAIFPCEVTGKRPLTKHGLKDATTDPDQVKAWWQREPQANIGIATGHLFDVVDVDGPQGRVTIAPLWDEFAALAYGIAKTGNGWHLYIPPTPGAGNTASKIGPGVDTRALGGYVIAPPSRHATGSLYTWNTPLTLPVTA